jgi:hypothetical protein
MSLTKLSLAENNLIIPAMESLVSDIPGGDGKIDNLFLQCMDLRQEDEDETRRYQFHLLFSFSYSFISQCVSGRTFAKQQTSIGL